MLEKLAALIPPPRLNLVRYHGILAPHGPRPEPDRARSALAHGLFDAWGLARACLPPPSTYFGGALLARVFALDLTVCPACGGRLRLIAALTDPTSVRRDLQGVGLPTEPSPLIPLERPHPSKGGTSPHNLRLDATLLAAPSKSVYPRPISPYNKPLRPSGRAEPQAPSRRAKGGGA